MGSECAQWGLALCSLLAWCVVSVRGRADRAGRLGLFLAPERHSTRAVLPGWYLTYSHCRYVFKRVQASQVVVFMF